MGDGEDPPERRTSVVKRRLAAADDVSEIERILDAHTEREAVPTGAEEPARATREPEPIAAKLHALGRTTRDLVGASSVEDIAGGALVAMRDIMDIPASAFFEYDTETDRLVRVAQTDRSREILSRLDDPPDTFDRGEGLVWEAFADGDVRVYDDLREADAYNPDTPFRSEMMGPIGDYGIVVASSTDEAAFTDADVEMARILATTLESAFERVERDQQLRSLQQVTRDLMVAASMDDIADATLRATQDVLNLPVSSLWRYDDETDRLVCVRESDPAAELLDAPAAFDRGEGLAWETFADGDVRVYDDLREYEEVYNPDTPLRSELIAPAGDRGLVIAADTEPASFSDRDVEMARILGANVEASLQRLHRERELQEKERNLTLLKQLLSRVLRHNLRNELSVIRNCAEVITDRTSERVEELTDSIVDATENLISTSENARTVERLVERDASPVAQNLQRTVEEGVGAVDVPPDATVEIDVPADCTVRAVPELKRALQEVVENALVHGGETPTVTVQAREHEETVVLSVVDDGPGIPDAEIAILDRGEETPLNHGSGMGLWLVDRVVESSGGTLSFTVDDGTRAEMRLDIADVDG